MWHRVLSYLVHVSDLSRSGVCAVCAVCAVCVYVYIYVCMYVCMYVCIYLCMYVCMYVRVYVRVCVCMYVCMYMYVCVQYTVIHSCKTQVNQTKYSSSFFMPSAGFNLRTVSSSEISPLTKNET